MTMAASALGKRFRAPGLSAEEPDFRLRPCVQSAAWTSVSCFAGRKRFLQMECEIEHSRTLPDDAEGTLNALLTEPYDGGVNP